MYLLKISRAKILCLSLLLLTLLLGGCSTRKNTAYSRWWQAFNTRYNVYFNGKKHYDEQLKDVENKYEDDYSQRLYIHPAEAHASEKATKPSGNFDRTIEKMQKAIALHSIKKKPKGKSGKRTQKEKEWLKREEYNPFLHNAWFTMAKAQYMNGDFLGSAATFHYITRHFQWLPNLVLESKLWEALCYCALGWNNEADNILVHIHPEKIEDSKQLALYNMAMADYHIKEKNTAKAAEYLAKAVQKQSGAQKVRQYFLLGQLYADNGQKELAYKAFGKAGSSNGTTYRTKFNARIQQSAVFNGKDIAGEVRALKRMTNFDRNKDYLDQIYFAIGNLYLSRKDTANAIANYVKANEKSTRNGIEKAINNITLGGIYFDQHKYDLAQPCYSEAVPMLKDDYPNYKALKKRSDVLDELAVYAQNVTLQDSLLRLSAMTEEQQLKVIKKIIDELKKKEKEAEEESRRQEYEANASARGDAMGSKNNAPQTFQMNNDKSWYFYNTATKNAGKTEFQKVWGNRKLEDNWRRRNKNVFSFDTENEALADSILAQGDSINVPEKSKEELEKENDPHFPEYYIKQIPKTDEERENSHSIIQEGLYNMGLILKDNLEDFPSSIAEFKTLLSRYPDNIYRLDTYYNMYLMYMRMGDTATAEHYRLLITTEFGESPYGMAMLDPNYIENLRTMHDNEERLYANAYESYLNNENILVHAAYKEMNEKYPLSKIMPKFMFIDALCNITERNYDQFKTTIKEMLERYPDTDITPLASSILKQLNQGREIKGGGKTNTRGMLWETRLTHDTTSVSGERKLSSFKDDPTKPHLYIFAYPTDSVSSNGLLYAVARHNFNKFVTRDYDLEQMTFGRIGLLVVKTFDNYDDILHYRTILEEDDDLNLPSQVRQVMISEANYKILINEGRSLEEYFDFMEHKNDEKVEEPIEQAIDEAEQTPDEAEQSEESPAEGNAPPKPAPAKEESPQAESSKEEPVKEEPAKEESSQEESPKEESPKEEPVKEEATQEEPVKEEAAKEEPVKEEPAPKDNTKQETPKETKTKSKREQWLDKIKKKK